MILIRRRLGKNWKYILKFLKTNFKYLQKICVFIFSDLVLSGFFFFFLNNLVQYIIIIFQMWQVLCKFRWYFQNGECCFDYFIDLSNVFSIYSENYFFIFDTMWLFRTKIFRSKLWELFSITFQSTALIWREVLIFINFPNENSSIVLIGSSRFLSIFWICAKQDIHAFKFFENTTKLGWHEKYSGIILNNVNSQINISLKTPHLLNSVEINQSYQNLNLFKVYLYLTNTILIVG